jgi:DNA-binding response OmpR family regulator
VLNLEPGLRRSVAVGEVVTLEELREAVWAQHTHVDVDRGINKAIDRLRQVLGDVPERPRFIDSPSSARGVSFSSLRFRYSRSGGL